MMTHQEEYSLSFNRVYTTYFHRFVRFARSYMATDEAAEDVVNDSFMYYWENRDTVVDQNLPAYLLSVVRHKCINQLKRQAIEEQAKSGLQSLEEWELQLKISTLEACNPEKLLSDEVQHLIRHALEELPSQTREILIRSRFRGQSNRIIAAELGISVKTVEYHITKALKALRIALGDYFLCLFFFIN